MHRDLAVDGTGSLDEAQAQAQAIGLGATKAEEQSAPESFRVLRDPAGHPFCLRR